ncbi:MAG: cytochrome c-type biogenesis protein, partial [Acidimicrobiales bacterium]
MDGPPLRSGRRAGLPATGGWPLPWPWLSWAVLAVLLAVGLTLGSGALAGAGPRTPAQRIAALDQVIGCPSCADLSVAESNAASAVAIRQFVAAQVRAGRSDRAVERAVEASYGPAILLAPPSSGPGALVWV